MPCSGNNAETCGGSWALSLYSYTGTTSSSSSSTTSTSSTTKSTSTVSTSTSTTSSPGSTQTLGSSCAAPVTSGTAGANDPFWLQNLQHQGTSAFNSNPSGYQVYRNVKDFGAKGDGVTDDTAAINNAISSGNRCGGSCGVGSTTLTPAIVFFPQGTYLVSSPIIAYYYTALVGDGRKLPTLLASAGFNGIAVIDADPYTASGQWYVNQDNFYRSVRNFIIDVTRMPATSSATGLHWQVSQATSLYNVIVNMSTASNTAHQGIFMENGSGGFMGDLVFNGGKYGIWIGNQQFTVRNITVNNAQIGVFADWNWGWTFQGLFINNCQIAFQQNTGGTVANGQQTAGAEVIIDAVITNTPIFLETTTPSTGSLAGSILVDNIVLHNVPTAIQDNTGHVLLAGSTGSTTIRQWAQGNVYSGTSGSRTYQTAALNPPAKPGSLVDSSGRILSKTRPQYVGYATSQFVQVKSNGAKGDGNTDDTAALQAIFNKYAGCKVIFFDAGTYIISDTLHIPPGTQIVGEIWSQIMVTGPKFQNINSPYVAIQVGLPGQTGIVEISDIIITTRGPTPGAILVEWNVGQSTQGSAGVWDTHIRLGGAQGTNLQSSNCPTSTSASTTTCLASYLAFHITSSASAYLEGLWIWLADHDLDQGPQLTAFSGRGILSQSQGPVWYIGTAAEHHATYQYSLVGAKNHYIGLAQTETPYYQPTPPAPQPFKQDTSLSDPTFSNGQTSAWALWIQNSSGILIYGAGFYSFFSSYASTACLAAYNCQSQIVNIDSASTSGVQIYSLSTVGTTWSFSVNQNGIINQNQNSNSFASTITAWV
ncbi:pectin lyase-like protein [Sistotremastrum niveocremeum HHB9708]|uniref:Pectin lyase-like protein n=2 Tax=Sistotremastraceae TaxID=3402574 RepID=A0A164UZ73_9AGAM|nr:pectin lyase-like protein [Sistotremastrum niveocremeum HHB9708]KZT37826.1 pectin lyase-like protein [Sistotremastrum suecicum HHB10207 ss-3]